MAVKVMLASAIANGELERTARKVAQGAAKPRRRRSSVYDADGNEVFITLMCLKCHKMRPLAQFGLRRMADGAIRNQPWCRGCRSTVSGGEERGRKGAEIAESLAAAASGAEEAATPPPEPARPAPKAAAIAAEVAAALAAGLRR